MAKSSLVSRILFCTAVTLGATACTGSNSAAPPSSAAAVSTPTASLGMSPNPATIAPGGSLTLTPSGGVPPYQFTISNSFGSVTASSGASTVFIAPSTTGTAQLQVVDAANDIGYFTIAVVGATPTPTPTVAATGASAACGGSYTITIDGSESGSMGLVVDDNGYMSGFINLSQWNYPIFGTCNLTTGSMTFQSLDTGSNYTGTVSGSSGVVQMSGSLTDSGQTYSWSATQTAAVATPGGTGGQACESNLTATLDGTSATMALVGDEAGDISGYIYVESYYFPVLGSCINGTITFNNLDTGSTYSGTYSTSGTSTSGTTLTMSGSYTDNGTSYSWSASGTAAASSSPVL